MEHISRFKGIFVLVGIFLALFLGLESWQTFQDIRRPDFQAPAISITGEGKVFVKPDIGQINLGVSVDRSNVLEAQQRAAELVNRVLAVLKEKGIEEKDIKTTNYSIHPRYDYLEARQVLKGYEVTQNFEVKIRDLSKVGEVLSAAASTGANQVGGLVFTTEDPATLLLEARDKAIEDAKRKAEELSKKLGVRLGKVIGFGEFGGPPGPIPYFAFGKGGDRGGELIPEIPPGENEIRVNVTITYQIK